MSSPIIQIHEFSTGIRYQKTTNGWVSLGFTGQYMNVTFNPIPDVIERSIANREFAVAEGASSDKPAIIGRVLGTGENTFSVLAIVTRGRDEKGRSASMYRYFFTQGSEGKGYQNLRRILAWWESQQTPLIFNPFDIQELGKPHRCDINTLNFPTPMPIDLGENDTRLVLLSPEQQYDLQSINALALKKYNANPNGQPISWGFNVEALEKPERFLVIQAASQRAYQILQKAITSTPNVLALAPVLIDEEAIKSAIRGLMNSSQVKKGNVEVIANALRNKEIISEYWHTLFDGQGAKTAISQKIYSPQMVRLITLRAVVIPETMLEFLAWLNIKPGQKPDDTQTISLEFQKAIRADLPKDKLANSIKFILPELLKKSLTITPEAVCWLLRSNDSLWASCRQEFVNDVQEDLQLIVDNLSDNTSTSSYVYKCDPQTWDTLNNYKNLIYDSNRTSHDLEKYTSFAKLFEKLQEYPLAAYFYQVSQGVVPKKVFQKLPDINNDHSPKFLELCLNREVTWLEEIINFVLKEYSMKINISIPLLIFVFMVGVLTGSIFLPSNLLTVNPNDHRNNQLAIAKQDENIETSQKAINQIVINIKNLQQRLNLNLTDEEIRTDIVAVLKLDKQDYQIDNQNLVVIQDRNSFVKAIYEYQTNKFSNIPNKLNGILDVETTNALEKEVKNKFIKIGKAIENKNFQRTRSAVDQVIRNISEDWKFYKANNKLEYAKIIQTIAKILDVDKLNYSGTKIQIKRGDKVIKQNPSVVNQARLKWVKAIYKYQQKNFEGQNNWDGIISPNGQTAQRLEEDMRQELGLPLLNPPLVR